MNITRSPGPKPKPVVGGGDFPFAAMHLNHAHIHGMCRGLSEAGGELRWVFDPDADKAKALLAAFPGARAAASEEQVLADPQVRLVAAAHIPNLRGELGCQVMRAGKDYFTDKAPFTELSQLQAAKRAAAETGRKYAVYFSERLHVECAVFAGQLIREGAIGRVLQVVGLGPHRLNAGSRPSWFFRKNACGGILCDLGSHQIEQFLSFTGARDARVVFARVEGYAHPEHPQFEDFGEAALVADNGAGNYFRVDWFTPDGLSTWGDGRTFILGSEGTIELRKYLDLATARAGEHLLLVNGKGESRFALAGQVGFPFFGELILDCLERTERAMSQAHVFKAAELALAAQALADGRRGETA
jgi:predicted dehydrogenase